MKKMLFKSVFPPLLVKCSLCIFLVFYVKYVCREGYVSCNILLLWLHVLCSAVLSLLQQLKITITG